MPNALIHESSPYLRQHAHNPVDWLPWCEESFARAQLEQKPVFLSIGYSTCHWCHVMEHESFENQDIALLMNENFINIKVDREEMPDVDATYMAFVQATTGQGGWPMSVWLTPTAEPILGGTYFPPIDRQGRAGFPRVCREIARLWSEDSPKMQHHAQQILTQLQQQAAAVSHDNSIVSTEIFERFFENCDQQFDEEYGGFGGAPKFPRPAVLLALMQIHDAWGRTSDNALRARLMVETTLKAIALGGICDHLGGGFHRYSVDRYWHVPHYEKMLYDQAQLADAYLDAWQITHNPLFRTAAEEIFRYLLEALRDANGGFHAAEDADSLPQADSQHKREGAYWTWTAEEISALLDPRAAMIFSTAYGIQAEGNARPESDPHGELEGQNTLYRAMDDDSLAMHFSTSVAEIHDVLAAAKNILLEKRSHRPAPHRDDKIIAAWNGLTIAALARGARVLQRPDLAQAARDTAIFVCDHMQSQGKIQRYHRGKASRTTGGPANYAFMIRGLIELHEFSPEDLWLEKAMQWQSVLDQDFWSEEHQGYVMRTQLHGRELLCIREDYDGAEPAPNHIAAQNLLKLSALTSEQSYYNRAESLLRAGTTTLQKYPFAAPALIVALDLYHRGIDSWTFQGEVDCTSHQKNYQPRSVFTRVEGQKMIMLCQGQTCRIIE